MGTALQALASRMVAPSEGGLDPCIDKSGRLVAICASITLLK
jgi:hypothetical protein